MKAIKNHISGIIVTIVIAVVSMLISGILPFDIISASVIALFIGIAVNPFAVKYSGLKTGIGFVSKKILRTAIILFGLRLTISQVLEVGKYSLIVMAFTLLTAFGGGYLFGKLFKMDWKLSSLISTGTGICGGSAIAAVAPVIEAEDRDIAYAISVTFIFDVLMVVLFPIVGKLMGMSDLGFGLWTGTAVNDTSSVVAAGYAFSDIAGAYSVIVKLTRTLMVVPVVLIFSVINQRVTNVGTENKKKISIAKIFPFFIILFLGMVVINNTGIIPSDVSGKITDISKFLMVMALGAIGLKTNLREMMKSGLKPLLHGFIISMLVAVVSLMVQVLLNQI